MTMEVFFLGEDVLLSGNFTFTRYYAIMAFSDGVDEPVILSRVNKLRHMHIHDAVGRHPHLPLGSGELDLPKYFHLAKKHKCHVVID